MDIENKIKEMVDKIFAEKEEKDMKQRTQAALTESANTIDTLKEEIKSLEKEIKNLEEQVKEEQTKNTQKTEEVSALKAGLEEARIKIRVGELEKAGVLTNKDKQAKKVKTMSDDDFEDYKEELSSIRTSAIEEAKKKNEDKEEEAEDTPKGKKKNFKNEEKEEDAEDTPKGKKKNVEEKEEKEEDAEEDTPKDDVNSKNILQEVKNIVKNLEGQVKSEELNTIKNEIKNIEQKMEEKNPEAVKSDVVTLKNEVKNLEKKKNTEQSNYVPPAHIPHNSYAAMNFEIFPADDMFKKYAALGDALADSME